MNRRRTASGPVVASLYMRMSLDRTGEGLGVERQEKECRELCERMGFEVGKVYTDNDISATKGRVRPGFEALLASGPEAIVVWHMDRLVRLTRDLERVIDLGCNVYAVAAGHVDLSNPAGRAVARTITAFAAYEGENKAERQKASARQRASAGRPWWSSRPFGFERDTSHRDEEAQALREAYTAVLTGVSLRSVAQGLNDRDLLTNRGNPWTAMTLRPVLLNARNAGLREYEGEIVGPAAWAPIVPEETWRATVSLLTSPSRRTSSGPRRRNLLTGIAACGKCGSAVKVAWRNGRASDTDAYSTYVCRAKSCVSHRVEFTDGLVVREIMRLLQDPEWSSAWQSKAEDSEVDVVALRVEESTLRQRLTDLSETFVEGGINKAQLVAGSERISARLAELGEAMAHAGRLTLADIVNDVEHLYQEFDGLDVERQRALVSAVLESVTLMPIGRGVRLNRSDHVVIVPRMGARV